LGFRGTYSDALSGKGGLELPMIISHPGAAFRFARPDEKGPAHTRGMLPGLFDEAVSELSTAA